MTPSIDSHASLSPLDLLAPPPPRETDRGDSFAQHLQPPSPPAQRPAEQDRSVPRASEQERSAPQRSSEQERSEQSPAKEPVRQSVEPARQEERSEDKGDQAKSAPTEASAATGEQADDEHHVLQQVEEILVAVPAGEKDEETGAGPESDLADELLLTNAAIVPQPVAVAPEAPTTGQDASAPVVAIVADEDQVTPAKGTAPQGARQPQALPEAAFDLQPMVETETTTNAAAETPRAADAPVVDLEPVTAVANVTAETPAIVVATAAAPKLEAGEQSGTDSTVQEATTDHKDGEQPVDEAETSDGQMAIEVAAPVAKSRDGRRERQRGDTRATTAKSESGDAGAPVMKAGQADAVAKIEPAAIASAPATETRPADATTNVPPPAAPSATTTVAQPTGTGQRLPQHLLARGTQRGSAGAPPNPAEQARFVQRVAKAFQTAQSGSGEIQLRLSPPELGSLKLEIKVQNGVLTARVEAETATAKNMIVDSLPVLKERLAEQGIQVERFDVDLMDRHPQGQPDSPQERERRSLMRQPHFPKPADPAVTTTTTKSDDIRPMSGDGRLNVTV